MELLKQLYRIYSPSGKERAMRRFIIKEVKKVPGTRIEKAPSGNLYVTKGNAPDYPCIVAHMDQVQGTRSTDFMPVETKEVIFGYSPKHRRQENLGADDKNGIWIALKCLKQYPVLKLAFFVSEETGCIGSGNARMDFFTDCRFVIEPDRRGYKDIIPLIGWTVLCSDEFLKATGYRDFGYEETEGMLTDVLELKEKGLAVSCINLSCGYYEPHTPHEFTVKKDLLNCLDLVRHIIGHCTGTYPHTHECTGGFGRYPDGFSLYEDEYGEAADEIFNLLDSDDTLSVEDLTYMYNLYFPKLGRSDFEQIYRDYHELRGPRQKRFKSW